MPFQPQAPLRFRPLVPLRSALRALAPWAALLALACGGGLDDRVDRAREHLVSGDVTSAVTVLNEVVSRDPQHREAHYLLGLAYLRAGRPDFAVGPLAKSAASEEYGVRAGVPLASALLAAGDPNGAVAAASRVLEVAPDREAALHTRAQAQLALGRPDPALGDADALLALDPDALGGLRLRAHSLTALGRLDEAEAAHLRLRDRAAAEQPSLAGQACVGLASFRDGRGDPRATATWQECLDEHPADVIVVSAAADAHRRRGELHRAEAVWRGAVGREPENLAFRAGLADLLARQERGEEAERTLRELAEGTDSPQAWLLLAHHCRQHGRPAPALEAIGRAEAGATPEQVDAMRLLAAQLRVEMGDLDGAEAAASGLRSEASRVMLRGLLLEARGRPAEALAVFEDALARTPQDANLHFLAGRSARAAGEWEAAARHLGTADRIDPRATDAALLVAQLQLEAGLLPGAETAARRHLQLRSPGSGEALLVLAAAVAGQGRIDEARALLEQAEQLGAAAPDVAIQRSRIARRQEGPGAAVRALRASGLDWADPANEEALRVLIEDLVAHGRRPEALRTIRARMAAQPERLSLREAEARVLLVGGERAAARRGFEAVLEREPEHVAALAGLGELDVIEGRRPEAVALFDRATRADLREAGHPYRAAQILLAEGDSDGAEERLRLALRRAPGHALACNDLAWILAEKGEELELALELARRATRLDDDPTLLDTLGWVQLKSGRSRAAAAAFRQATERDPRVPLYWYHLGLAQAASGAEPDARASLEKALAFEEFSEADEARAALARLESAGGASGN